MSSALSESMEMIQSILQSPDDGTSLDANFVSEGGIKYDILPSGIINLYPRKARLSNFVYSSTVFEKWNSIIEKRIQYYTKKESIAGLLANYSYRSIRKFDTFNDGEWILDIGCGDGSQLAYLKNRSFYIGLDTNLKRLEILKKHYPDVVAIYGDAATLPFKSSSIKNIFSCNAFEHIWYLKDAVFEIFRCIQDDGYSIIVVPTEGGLWNLGRTLISKPAFRKANPEINFDLISHIEHCNIALQIVRTFETYFNTAKKYKPFLIPTIMLNAHLELHCTKKKLLFD